VLEVAGGFVEDGLATGVDRFAELDTCTGSADFDGGTVGFAAADAGTGGTTDLDGGKAAFADSSGSTDAFAD